MERGINLQSSNTDVTMIHPSTFKEPNLFQVVLLSSYAKSILPATYSNCGTAMSAYFRMMYPQSVFIYGFPSVTWSAMSWSSVNTEPQLRDVKKAFSRSSIFYRNKVRSSLQDRSTNEHQRPAAHKTESPSDLHRLMRRFNSIFMENKPRLCKFSSCIQLPILKEKFKSNRQVPINTHQYLQPRQVFLTTAQSIFHQRRVARHRFGHRVAPWWSVFLDVSAHVTRLCPFGRHFLVCWSSPKDSKSKVFKIKKNLHH